MDREVGASFNFEGSWKWVASFVMGLKSGGGANISGLESGVGNKLQERTGKWGGGQSFTINKHKKGYMTSSIPFYI